VLYSDDNHLSATFSRTLASALERSIEDVLHKTAVARRDTTDAPF
jgi:hypothetical protein